MATKTKERVLTPTYDEKGNIVWKSHMSPPDDSIAVVYMVPDRIIPVIFVPGVMGSNLKSKENPTYQWRLDSASTMVPWLSRGARERKKILTPRTMILDDAGQIPKGTAQHPDELKRRGWGGVGAMSYSTFLVWLENSLNDFNHASTGPRHELIGKDLKSIKGEQALTVSEVALSYKYRFPVHAFGYNWLDDNSTSSKRLMENILETIGRYNKEKKMCEKVIIVTHSMGGLVARHCSEFLEMSNYILGIVHGVMPAQGAPAVYRRFKCGTEGDYIPSEILGNDAAEMTAVLSSAPGPMQLLPTPSYGNNWLNIKAKNTDLKFPKKLDPYNEIYLIRGKWWSMCDERLINPQQGEQNSDKKLLELDADWRSFSNMIKINVKKFHESIENRYHNNTYAFIGSTNDHLAYGTVTWHGTSDYISQVFSDRKVDVLNATQTDISELGTSRTISSKFIGSGWQKSQNQSFAMSDPEEKGDGTVPYRSGIAPKANNHIKSMLELNLGHESAFRDSDLARQFTLRAIVKIAQNIRSTSLCY